MTSTRTTVNAALKELYPGGGIEEQFSQEVVAYKRLERSKEGITVDAVGGKYVTFPIRTKRNPSISYRAEGGAIATAGQQSYAATQVPLRYGYGRLELTGQVMELAESNAQAFANMMEEEYDGLKNDVVKDSGRIAHGNATNNSVVGMATVGATSATQNVTNPFNFDIGGIYDAYNTTADTSIATGLTVSSINYDTGDVVFSSSHTSTTATGYCRTGSYALEPTGLLEILKNSGTLHNIDPSTTVQWKANVSTNSGTNRALSEGLMIKMCDIARIFGGKTSVIFTSLGVRRAYFNLLTQQRGFVNTKEFAGGFVGLPFNYGREIPVVEDPQAHQNKMLGIDESKMKLYSNKDWHWADADGNTLKYVTGYDKWEALLKKYWEVGTTQRNAHWIIEDIIEG